MRSVLLVHPDAERWQTEHPALATATTAPTATAARAYLAGTAFDLILIGPGVEGAEAIAALRDVLGLSTPVEPVDGPDAAVRRLSGRLAPAGEGHEALEEIRDELSRVAHALNNPLAVIAGNAQLAQEMARMTPTDETIVESLDSIASAASQLEGLFAEVGRLRALVDRALGR